ncbi:MAG TPA: SMP-30/gluconolactonase/LRE family protein [Burkholderiaceae bacterium]|nr:SMP-30/gluconolactonase/LRE family protein [Burkholderiaceae bacterium]
MKLVAQPVADTRCSVGESPVWDRREQRLYWVDINAATILRLEPDGSVQSWKMPEKVGCIAPHAGGGWIAAMQSTVRRVHLRENGAVDDEVLARVQHTTSPMRFNDGRCDRQGRFWVGTMFEDTQAGNAAGRLYRFTGKAGLQYAGIDALVVPNGIAYSPDGRTMYLSDTWRGTRLIWAFDYDTATGTPGNRRVFVDMHAHVGRPDGAAVDVDGCYWSCAGDGGCVLRFDPSGRLIGRVDLPVRKPAMAAFGGPELDTLYITSIRPQGVDLSDQPLAGGLFAVRPGVTGLPEPAFDPGA